MTTGSSSQTAAYVRTFRFLWIKVALLQKKLSGIVDHLVANSSKYYDKEALLSDPVGGEIFASLLIGPCALDYSKIKSQDQFWSDPTAEELLERHRMSNFPAMNGNSTPPPTGSRRPLGVTYRWPTTSLDFGAKLVTNGGSDSGNTSLACSPRDHVDSLHQNCRSTLLYGKNNVLVRAKGQQAAVPGYLSLHSTPFSLTIKWTPNQMMHPNGNNNNAGPEAGSVASVSPATSSHPVSLWDLAMNVNMEEIVYLHCHHSEMAGGTIVLVGQDGVQKAPLVFPPGGHLLSFLSCLETGLQPFGQMDPPLAYEEGRGKVFPRLRLKGKASSRRTKSERGEVEHETMTTSTSSMGDKSVPHDPDCSDYVFRILANFHRPDSISKFNPDGYLHSLLDI